MKPDFFQQRIEDCACGQSHSCPIQEIVVGRNVIPQAAQFLNGLGNVLIVSDANTRPLAFAQLTEALRQAGIQWKEAFFNQTNFVIPDEESIAFIQQHVTEETQALVGIGSGVINDLCKYVSFSNNLPYMIIATAPSMDGYASVGAALDLEGMKVTKNAAVVSWILGDVDVLKTAPIDMIRAGIGDILGKYSCLNDWKLASLITGEHFCQKIYDMVMTEILSCKENIEGCLQRDPEAIGCLFRSLVMVGVAMSYLGNSRPASGSEHHFSHYFELTGILRKQPYLPHGIDVGYSTVLTAALREMLAEENPDSFARCFEKAAWLQQVDEVYGPLSAGVKALQESVGWYQKDYLPTIREKWTSIVDILKEAPGHKEMQALLARAGYRMEKFVDFYGMNRICECVRWAKELKDRYTVLWVLENAGLAQNAADTIAELFGAEQ